MLKPVEKQRVAEEIAEQLRSLILNGQYPPGSKLPPERELSKRLRVNRASLREALKKLEHLGLVRIRQGDGTRVQNFMETGGIELVQHLLPLAGGKPELIRDLLEFRRIFGRELARLAAARVGKDQTTRLRALADKADQTQRRRRAVRSRLRVLRRARRDVRQPGHAAAASTPCATACAGSCRCSRTSSARTTQVRKHHRELIAAIERGDAATAGRVADDYLRMGAELAGRLGGRRELQPRPLPD